MRKRTAVIFTMALCGLTAGLIWTPVAKANVYAAHLSGPATWNTGVQGNVMLEYRLNEPATSVTVEVFRTSAPATVVKTIVGTTNYGLNSVAWDGSKDGGGNAASASDYAFRVIAGDITGHATWTNITPLDGGNEIGSAQYYAPVGLAVNKDKNSPNFGNIYVSSSEDVNTSSEPNATAVGDGIFMLRNDMTFTGANAAASFIGIPDSAVGADFNVSPWKININPDNSDEIVVSDFNDGYENVWIVQISSATVNKTLDKGNLGNHGNAISAWLQGTGTNRKLWTIDEDFNAGAANPSQTAGFDVLRFDIGNTLVNFTGAPFEVANGSVTLPGAAGINYSDRDLEIGYTSGALYVVNRRFNQGGSELAATRYTLDGSGKVNGATWTRTNPSLTAEIGIGGFSWNRTYAVAVDEPRNRVAIGRDGTNTEADRGGQIVILDATTGAKVDFFDSGDANTSFSFRDCEWDVAGNLITANQYDEHVRMWSPPDGSNAFTTTYYATMDVTISGAAPTAPSIADANSVKAHGGVGSFSVDLWNAGANTGTVENRQGGPTSVVVQFDKNIQQVTGTNADVLMVNGTVSALAVAGDTLTVTTSGAVNGVVSTMTFPGIATAGSPLLVNTQTLCIRPLVGDADNGGAVNIFDLIQIRNNLNQPVAAANFRSDVTAEGNINIFDLIATRNALNVTVPACP